MLGARCDTFDCEALLYKFPAYDFPVASSLMLIVSKVLSLALFIVRLENWCTISSVLRKILGRVMCAA